MKQHLILLFILNLAVTGILISTCFFVREAVKRQQAITTHCRSVECVIEEAIYSEKEIPFRFENRTFSPSTIKLVHTDTVLCSIDEKNCEIEVLVYEQGKVNVTCMNDIKPIR